MLSLTDEARGKPGGITLGSVDNELIQERADILADELLAYHYKGVCGRAAKMLRRQQELIAELEKELAKYPKQGQSIPCKYTEGM